MTPVVDPSTLDYFSGGAIRGYIAFQVVVLLIVLGNSWVWRRLARHEPLPEGPLVSLLVPCRNEETNVRPCTRALLAQTYPDLEVVMLDDRSEDGTLAVLEEERARDPRVRIVVGEEVPAGWTGKNWACHQLSLVAQGDMLLYLDADVVLRPDAVRTLVGAIEGERADLLSAMPRELATTLGEQFFVPVFCWALFSFWPLMLGLLSPRLSPPAAVGQIMMFRRRAYETIGGHAAVRSEIVDDIALARRVRKAGLESRLADGTSIAECRMYRGGREAYEGFRKNLFAVFGSALLPYLFVWIWLGFVYLEPIALLTVHLVTPGTVFDARPIWATVVLALAQWVCVYARLRLPVWPAFLYPLTMLAFEVLALGSLTDGLRGKTVWKGRSVEGRRVRIL